MDSYRVRAFKRFWLESQLEASEAEPLAVEAMGIFDLRRKEWKSKFIAGNRAPAREVFAIGFLIGVNLGGTVLKDRPDGRKERPDGREDSYRVRAFEVFVFETPLEACPAEPLAEESLETFDRKWQEIKPLFVGGNRRAAREVFAIGNLLGVGSGRMSEQRVA